MNDTLQKFMSNISILTLFFLSCFAQLDSIFDQGVNRTFILHKPLSYNIYKKYPIIVGLHGLNSNAQQKELHSPFYNVADTAEFIIVYPNVGGGIRTLALNSNVDYISSLVDTILSKYSSVMIENIFECYCFTTFGLHSLENIDAISIYPNLQEIIS